MRLITYTVEGVKFFAKPVRIDLYATSMVQKDSVDVRRCLGNGSRICTETLLAFTGLNETGKTTLLRLFDFVVNLVSGDQLGGYEPEQTPLLNLVSESGLNISAIFEHARQWYLLESRIMPPSKRDEDSTVTGSGSLEGWQIEDETLYHHADKVIAKKELKDMALFKANSTLERRRTDMRREILAALGSNKSVTASLGISPTMLLNFGGLSAKSTDAAPIIAPQVGKDLYPSVHNLELDNNRQAYLQSIADVLLAGGYLVVDEIENNLDKELLQTLLDSFAHPLSNPHGAVLVFSTHSPELLDYMPRTDNIYLARRSKRGAACVKLSTLNGCAELKHSDMFLGNCGV